jgi:hypothetical protein
MPSFKHLLCSFLAVAVLVGLADAEVIKAPTAPVEITVPAEWTSSPLADGDDAAIKLMILDKDQSHGVIILYEPGAAMDLTLAEYGKMVITQMAGRHTEATYTDFKPVKVDGHDALRCELKGVRENIKLAYVVTVVKAEKSYDQVLAFSTQSQFADSKATLTKISDSFKVHAMPPAAKDAPQVVVAGKNGNIEMHLPAGWAKSDPGNSDAQLLAVNDRTGCYVQVISEDRRDLTFTLKEYADKAADGMLHRGTDGSKTSWKSVKINGNDAVQCDLHLTTEHVKLTYLVTIIQTPDNFHQVLAWTLASAFEKLKPELAPLANGLKEIKHN